MQLKVKQIWQYHDHKISRQYTDRYLQCKQSTVLTSTNSLFKCNCE